MTRLKPSWCDFSVILTQINFYQSFKFPPWYQFNFLECWEHLCRFLFCSSNIWRTWLNNTVNWCRCFYLELHKQNQFLGHKIWTIYYICTYITSCNNVTPVTNLCLGRATTRSHSSQWSKKKSCSWNIKTHYLRLVILATLQITG
jgi:hypothetical protein